MNGRCSTNVRPLGERVTQVLILICTVMTSWHRDRTLLLDNLRGMLMLGSELRGTAQGAKRRSCTCGRYIGVPCSIHVVVSVCVVMVRRHGGR